MLRTSLLWAAPLLFAAPIGSRDLWAYAAQANVAAHGINPYLAGPSAVRGVFTAQVSALWVRLPSPYGPAWVGLTAATRVVIGNHPSLVVESARLLAAMGFLILAVTLPVLAKRAHNDTGRVLWAALANPLILVDGIGGGHNDLLMAALVSAGLAVATSGWELLPAMAAAGGLVGLATSVKLQALIAVPFLAVMWSRRRSSRLPWRTELLALTVAIGACLAVCVVITTCTGFGFRWVAVVAAHHHSGGATGIALIALATIIAWERSRVWEPTAMVAAAATAMLMVIPLAQWWYWIYPIALAAPLLRRRATAVVLASISLTLLLKVRPDGNALIFRQEAVIAATLLAAWLLIDRTPPSSWTHPAARQPATVLTTVKRHRRPF